jgi:DNA polymerase-3 subunit alpha
MGFDAYFLIVWDLCREAAARNIWYTARGSAAGSIVAYCLRITTVDPLQYGLIFERFLNPDRISMPDIDLDFPDDRRAEMMAYCADQYGHDKVAQIVTFGTMKARAAVRDVGRVMDISLEEVDRVAKLIPAIPGKPVTIAEAIEQVPDLKKIYASDRRIRDLLDTAQQLDGVVRNAGTHAAGVVVTDKPIIEYAPLQRPTSNDEDLPIKTVTQFEMNIIEKMGLLKIDFLGLITLTVMARACELIKQRHGIEFTLDNIPVDDPESFRLMGNGDTAGVFQVEGSGMTRFIIQMQPENLENVVAMIALFRPGPMDFIPSYIARMHGREAIQYDHPALQPIFQDTFGIAVYQEQIMRAAVEVAGYTNAEADDLRKAIAKKIHESLAAHRQKFVDGAERLGSMPRATADQVFEGWLEFARYGFNKSHAVAYGVIAVQTAYLKARYPLEFMSATLSAYQSDLDRVALYAADCRRMGIPVLPPDVNTSGWDFTIEDRPDGTSCIRFGMGAVKNVGQGPVEAIMDARRAAPFTDLTDFARRVDLRQVGKRPLESLIKVGALDSFGGGSPAIRPALLAALDRITALSASHFRAAEIGQMTLFGSAAGLVTTIALPSLPADHTDRRTILNWERELIGLYVSDHPLTPYLNDLRRAVSHMQGELADANHGDLVRVAGLITKMRRHLTKAGKPMAFATIEDVQGPIEIVIFSRAWEKYAALIEVDNVILVEGTVDAQGADPKILANTISTEFTLLDPLPQAAPPSPPRRQILRRADVTPEGDVTPPAGSPPPANPDPLPVAAGIAEPAAPYLPAGAPPPPEAPPDWHMFDMFPPGIEEPPDEPVVPVKPAPAQEELIPAPRIFTRPQEPVAAGNAPETGSPEAGKLPVFIPPPRTAAQPADAKPARMLTITLRANGDRLRDALKIQRIFGTVISYPGDDHFAFYVFEGQRSYLVEFPNFTTGINDEMLARLRGITGVETITVEPIYYGNA